MQLKSCITLQCNSDHIYLLQSLMHEASQIQIIPVQFFEGCCLKYINLFNCSMVSSPFFGIKRCHCRRPLYFLIGLLAGDRPPVIVFRSCWVTEGSDLETDLLTPAKRWKQKGNRAEKSLCFSWGVTYHTHTHTYTISETRHTERLRLLSQMQTCFLTHTNSCRLFSVL